MSARAQMMPFPDRGLLQSGHMVSLKRMKMGQQQGCGMNEELRSVFDLPFSERRYIAVLGDREFDRKRAEAPYGPYVDLISEALPLVVPGGIAVRAAAQVGIKLSASWFQNRSRSRPEKVSEGGLERIPISPDHSRRS